MSLIENWHEEKQSAWLYRAVAEAEPDAIKHALFIALADAAESQAGLWEQRLRAEGVTMPRNKQRMLDGVRLRFSHGAI